MFIRKGGLCNARPHAWGPSKQHQDPRETKKKQHACAPSGPRNHYSELLTWMAALKFEKAVSHSHYSSFAYLITDLASSN